MLLLGMIASNISPSDSISGYLNEGRVGVGGGGMNEKKMGCSCSMGGLFREHIVLFYLHDIYVHGTFGGGSKEKSCSKDVEI